MESRNFQSDFPKVYIYHIDHEHDRLYTENLVEYFGSVGILWRSLVLNAEGDRPELQLCLDDHPTAVLGYNSQLDHSWVSSVSFLEEAERRNIPVLQWILDHPSSRWAEFNVSSRTNSRFLLNSEQAQDYFETYCLPGALTATTGGVGPNQRSRIGGLTRHSFMRRPYACMIPLNLRRILTIEENEQALNSFDPKLGEATRHAIASLKCNLHDSLHSHVVAALAAYNQTVSSQMFQLICRTVDQAVQTFRRLTVFAAAQKYPVLIQSDDSAASFVGRSAAVLERNVSVQFTLARMPLCRAVLSVSPMSDTIHDRTMNALNAGCVAIAEDNLAGKRVFKHKENALLFRYDDDSLDECLDIVCNQPERAFEIAQAGMQLRDDPVIRFGQFHNIIKLAQRRLTPAAVGAIA